MGEAILSRRGGGAAGGKVTVAVTKPDPNVPQQLMPMTIGRYGLAAAVDGNGRVWVFGGWNPNTQDVDNTIEIYESGVRIHTMTMSVPRYEMAAATDGNGDIIVAGGIDLNSGKLSLVEKYTRSFTRTTLTPLATARANAAAATDGAGNVIIAGGNSAGGPVATVDRYTPSGTRTTLTPLATARANAAAARDGNGNVLIIGGDYYGSLVGTVDRYSTSGTRSALTPMTYMRRGHAAVTDGAGNVRVVGGANAVITEVYSKSGVHSDGPPLPENGDNVAAVADEDGNVWVFGGEAGEWSFIDNVMRISSTGVVTAMTPMSVKRGYAKAVRDGGGMMMVIGGTMFERDWIYTPLVEGYGGRVKRVTVPAYNAYKFAQHATEQPALPTDTTIGVEGPSTGYLRMVNGAITV